MRAALEAEPEPPQEKAAPRVAPSAELEAALHAALEAELAASPPPPSAPPKPRPAPPRAQPAPDEGAKLAPSPELEKVMRDLLKEESAARAAEQGAPKAPARPGRTSPAKTNVGDTMKEAVRQQKAMMAAGHPELAVKRPTNARVWIIIALLSVVGAVAGIFYIGTQDEPPTQSATSPTAPRGAGVSTQQAVQALRGVQSAIGPTLSLPAYQAKVAAAQSSLGSFLDGGASPEAKKTARETLDLYALAGAAWQARSTGSRDALESVGRSPVIETCPGVKQWADSAGSSAQARGRAVASSLTTLWECADRRTSYLERLGGGR